MNGSRRTESQQDAPAVEVLPTHFELLLANWNLWLDLRPAGQRSGSPGAQGLAGKSPWC